MKSLIGAGVIRPIRGKEFISERRIFASFVLRNLPGAGHYQARKIQYYTLTDEARVFFAPLEDLLCERAYSDRLEDLFMVLSRTHKRLEKERERLESEIERCINTLWRYRKDPPSLNIKAKIWAEKRLYVDPVDLSEVVTTAEKPRDAIERLRVLVHG